MVLTRQPRAPSPALFIKLAAPKVPAGWQPYLGKLDTSTSTAAA
jgi:hypothetical protein